MPYMLRADALDDDLGHEMSVAGGFDYDFDLSCTCGRFWHFTDPVSADYLIRVVRSHRGW